VVIFLATGVLVALGVVSSGVVTVSAPSQSATPTKAGVRKLKAAPKKVAASAKVAAASSQAEWEPSPYLCRLIIAEQQESREYYRRLAEGQVTKFEIGRVQRKGKHVRIAIRAYFIGLGYEDFTAENAVWRNEHFLTATTQGSPLASVANIGPDEEALGRQIMLLQHKYQTVLRDLATRKIAEVRITSVDRRLDESILQCTIVYRNGSTKSGTIEMRYTNGYWYIVNIKGSSQNA